MLLPQRIQFHHAALTASERTLAQALSGRYPDGLLDSASLMAASAGTSAATVVRFFAKLGYSSMADVRREARSQVTVRMQNPSQRSSATIGGNRSLLECVDDTLMHDLHNVQTTYEELDWEAFEAIVCAICDCTGRISVLAGENSMPVSLYLASHLNLCHPRVQELGSRAPFAIDRMLWVEPNDVLLAFSIRRYSPNTQHAVRQFHAQGAKVLAITDSMAAPIVKFAHHSLLVQTANASPFDSYTAAFFVCNAIVSAVAQRRKDAVAETLQRRDGMWSDLQNNLNGLLEDSPRVGRGRKAGSGKAAG